MGVRTRNLLAAVVAVTCVLATAVPAQAYYRERADRRGDVVVSDCGRNDDTVRRARLDLVKGGVSTLESSGTWWFTATAHVARLRKPGLFAEQSMGVNLWERGNRVPVLAVWATRNSYDSPRVSISYIDDSYPSSTPRVKFRGKRIILSGIKLKADKVYSVSFGAYARSSRPGDECQLADVNNRRVTGLQTH